MFDHDQLVLFHETNNETNMIRVLNAYCKYPLILNTYAMNTLLDPNLTQISKLSNTERSYFVSLLVRCHGFNKIKKTVLDFKLKIK
jgi:hypothetical protein